MKNVEVSFIAPYCLHPILLLVQEKQGYLLCLHGCQPVDLCPCCVQTQQVGPAIQNAVTAAIENGKIEGRIKWCMRWPIPGFTDMYPPINGSLFDIVSFDKVPADVLEIAEGESKNYGNYLFECASKYGKLTR